MKIAYILPSLDSKAPVFLAKRLSDYFVQLGCEVKVFYFDEIKNLEFTCDTERISMDTPIDFDYFDIVHSHMYRADKYVAKYSTDIKHAKTISTIHCNITEDLMYSYGRIVSFLFTKKWINFLKCFDTTVQINDYLMDLYSKKLRKNYLIYNGISISQEKDDYSEIIKKNSNF